MNLLEKVVGIRKKDLGRASYKFGHIVVLAVGQCAASEKQNNREVNSS